MWKLGSVLALTGLAATIATTGLAQQVLDAQPPGTFSESYDPIPNTSGGQMLGLRLVGGAATTRGAGPLFLKPDAVGGQVCIEVHTRDGRYSASNPFGIPDEPADWVRVAALSSAYADTLNGYDIADVAVRSFLAAGPDCNPKGAVNLPVSGAPAAPVDALEVLVNSGGLSVRAHVFAYDGPEEPPGAASAAAACGPAGDGARIAFNTICRFETAALPTGPVLLRLDYDDGFAVESVRYRMRLPEPAVP